MFRLSQVLYFIFLFCSSLSFKAFAQDTLQLKDLHEHVGRKLKLIQRVVDFDVRREYIYLYMGNQYPNQELTVIVKRTDGNKRIKVSKEAIVGRVRATFTGYIAVYDGDPDTTKNYDDAAIKKEYEKPQPMIVKAFNMPVQMVTTYKPCTAPINLKGKLVMLITSQKQIGATQPLPPAASVNFPPAVFDDPFD